MEKWENCPLGVKHETELSELKRRIDGIEKALIEIRDTLMGRPSWVMTLLLTSLFGICSSLTVWIVTHK